MQAAYRRSGRLSWLSGTVLLDRTTSVELMTSLGALKRVGDLPLPAAPVASAAASAPVARPADEIVVGTPFAVTMSALGDQAAAQGRALIPDVILETETHWKERRSAARR
jgi:hypothetical protein